MEEHFCGPKGTPEPIKRVLTKPVPGVDFNESCKLHDERYETPGYPKSKADLEFLGNNIKSNWWNPIGWVLGVVEYLAVAIGGRTAYENAQNEAQKKKKEQSK